MFIQGSLGRAVAERLRLVGKIQPKYLIIAGAAGIALSMYTLTNVYGDLGFWFMARSRMLFSAAFPFASGRHFPKAVLHGGRSQTALAV